MRRKVDDLRTGRRQDRGDRCFLRGEEPRSNAFGNRGAFLLSERELRKPPGRRAHTGGERRCRRDDSLRRVIGIADHEIERGALATVPQMYNGPFVDRKALVVERQYVKRKRRELA